MLQRQNLISELFEQFPSFEKKMCYEPDDLTPYNVLGDFALYLRDKIKAKNITEEEVNKTINFINTMGKSEDIEVLNILEVELFEIFTDDKETINWALKYLDENNKERFKLVLKRWSFPN